MGARNAMVHGANERTAILICSLVVGRGCSRNKCETNLGNKCGFFFVVRFEIRLMCIRVDENGKPKGHDLRFNDLEMYL